jgi:putative SOS response-associated peptidase YedK
MCYSAQIWADYRRYVREWGAQIDIKRFIELFWWKWNKDEIARRGAKPSIPKALEQAFAEPQSEDEYRIKRYIDEANERQALEWQQALFAQRARLVKAQQKLAEKPTKGAADDERIATDKIERLKGWLEDLSRTTVQSRDSRIYPQWYAPVMVMEEGCLVVKPMRYQCRPEGKPAFYDTKYPGCYNARRDNLRGFWKGQFGKSHGVMVATGFFENVKRHNLEHRELREREKEENVVLEFAPRPAHDMLVACLWSRWTAPGEHELLSFAAITDEPPAEVAAAGHDRCIVPLKAQNLRAWLDPAASTVDQLDALLDDRDRPYYEHRLAA